MCHFSIASCFTVQILQSQNKDSVTALITSENKNLGPALKMINMEGFYPEDLSERRKINNLFMQCLIEVTMGHRFALLWLMRNVDLQICHTILSDIDYSGTCIQVMMNNINWYMKLIQTILAHNIKGNFFGKPQVYTNFAKNTLKDICQNDIFVNFSLPKVF